MISGLRSKRTTPARPPAAPAALERARPGAGPPTRQQRRTDHTRGRLLDAALDVMLERGYERASLGEVTQRADLGTGTLYLHFRDKRVLYEALVRRELGRLLARWLEEEAGAPRAAAARDPSPRVARMVGVTLQFFAKNPDKARLLLCEGPPLETWLVDEVGRAIAEVIGPTVAAPELLANLIVGAVLAAGRWSVLRSSHAGAKASVGLARGRLGTRRLVSATAGFCAGGLAALARPAHRPTRAARSATERNSNRKDDTRAD